MFNFILKLFQLALSLSALALGVHGGWIFLNRAGLHIGTEPVKFLLVFDVPSQIQWFAQPMLKWMTNMSIENWYAPAVALFLGIAIKLSMEKGHWQEQDDKGTERNFISYRTDNTLMPNRRLRKHYEDEEEDGYDD